MNNKKHRSNTVFFVTQNPQLNTQPQVSTNTLWFFERLRKGYLPCFSPEKWHKQGLIYLLCVFFFFGRKGGLIAVPRMSKKRKQEWALFLNDRNRFSLVQSRWVTVSFVRWWACNLTFLYNWAIIYLFDLHLIERAYIKRKSLLSWKNDLQDSLLKKIARISAVRFKKGSR